MGCPIHIWAPLMATLLPAARVGRDRLRLWRADRAAEKAPRAPRTMRRFAPVAPGVASTSSPAEGERTGR